MISIFNQNYVFQGCILYYKIQFSFLFPVSRMLISSRAYTPDLSYKIQFTMLITFMFKKLMDLSPQFYTYSKIYQQRYNNIDGHQDKITPQTLNERPHNYHCQLGLALLTHGKKKRKHVNKQINRPFANEISMIVC